MLLVATLHELELYFGAPFFCPEDPRSFSAMQPPYDVQFRLKYWAAQLIGAFSAALAYRCICAPNYVMVAPILPFGAGSNLQIGTLSH